MSKTLQKTELEFKRSVQPKRVKLFYASEGKKFLSQQLGFQKEKFFQKPSNPNKSLFEMTSSELNYKILMQYKKLILPFLEDRPKNNFRTQRQMKQKQSEEVLPERKLFQDTQNYLTLDQFKKKIDRLLSTKNVLFPHLKPKKHLQEQKINAYFQDISG